MENTDLTGNLLICGAIFVIIMIVTSIKNIRDNDGFFNRYGLAIFTVLYTAFTAVAVTQGWSISIPEFSIGSIFYLAVCLSLTDFSMM